MRGALLGPLGCLLGIFGRPQGSPWQPLVGQGAPLGALLTSLGGHLGPILGALRAGAGPPGGVIGHFDAPKCPLSSNLGNSQVILGTTRVGCTIFD